MPFRSLSTGFLRKNANSRSPGAYYKYFRQYFEYLLSADNEIAADSHHEDWYVEDEGVTEFFTDIKSSNLDGISCLTGLPGIGKTTHIRHFFGDRTDPYITKDNHLIIPYYIDNSINPDIMGERDRLVNILAKSAVDIETKFHLAFSVQETANFVRRYRPSLTNHILPSEYIIFGDPDPQNILSDLRNKFPLAHRVLQLKQALWNSPIRKIFIIVDDIESADSQFAVDLLSIILPIRSCLMNTRERNKSYSTNIVISCRPLTYSIILSNNRMNGFHFSKHHDIDFPINLRILFSKRLTAAIRRIDDKRVEGDIRMEGAKDPKTWNDSLEVMDSILTIVEKWLGRVLIGYCNYNIRDALVKLQSAIHYPQWVVKDYDADPGAFKIGDITTNLTEHSILRSLILGRYKVLPDHSNGAKFLNPLYIHCRHESLRFIGPMIIKFIVHNHSTHYFTFTNIDLFNSLQLIFGPVLTLEDVNSTLKELESRDAIFNDGTWEEAKFIGMRYVTKPRIFYCWKLLGKSLTYVALCRDVFGFTQTEYDKLVQTGVSEEYSGPEIFQALAEFIVVFSNIEANVNDKINGMSIEDKLFLIARFGNKSITKKLFLSYSRGTKLYYAYDRSENSLNAKLRNDLMSRINSKSM